MGSNLLNFNFNDVIKFMRQPDLANKTNLWDRENNIYCTPIKSHF